MKNARESTLTLGLVALALTSCSRGHDEGVTDPVVVIGLDGLEWDVALPLLRAGRMPALEGLMERGCYGLLSTQAPAKSPLIWTTVATGKSPAEHGILDFTRTDGNGDRTLYSSADRTTKALWNILGDYGRTSVVLGWWTTFPVEEIDGVMVSQPNRGLLEDGGVEPDVAGQVHPVQLEGEVFAAIEEVDRTLPQALRSIYPDTPFDGTPANAANWDSCKWSIRADESIRHVALQLLRDHPLPDVFLVYFSSADVIGHRFWRFHEPAPFRHPPSAARLQELGEVVNRTYEQIDAALGELLAELPRDATILVLSDHGMQAKRVDARFDLDAGDPAGRESGGHGSGPPGVLIAAGPGVRRATGPTPVRELSRADLPQLGDVVDIAPTLLALRGVPIGRDMEGVVLETLFTPEFAQALAPRYVDTHDSAEWLAAQLERGSVDLPRVQERLEQLRSLGYIGDAESEED